MNKFILIVLSMMFSSVLAQTEKNITPESSDSTSTEVSIKSIIEDYPYYKTLQDNKELNEKFYKYMEWMNDKAPDAKLVFGFMKSKTNTLDAISTIFHEKVEFVEWLNLGHNFEDILNIEYYKEHYMKVYPLAHRIATIEEMNLIKYFAKKKNFKTLPEITFNLMSPLIEHHSVTVDKLHRRLKYNLEYISQLFFVTRDDLETAMRIYEAGGYKYNISNTHIENAFTFVKKSKITSP